MTYRKRRYYSEEDKRLIWKRWKSGASQHDIARLFCTGHSSIGRILSETGGFRPPDRKRSTSALKLSEREEISRSIVINLSIRSIAVRLSRAPSTISREINRNGGYDNYRATSADNNAWNNALRPKLCKLHWQPALCKTIETKLRKKWSPQQISGWLKIKYSEDESKHVSHETIYKSLFIQTRGVLKKELQRCLRSKRTIRRAKASTLKGRSLGSIPHAVSISERPSSVEDRAVPGHWEGDLIEGCKKTFIATLVERHSRYVVLIKLKDKKSNTVIDALIKQARKLPSDLYKTLTWDRGSEITNHQKFTLATDIQVYLCDPQSPWQRGSNENTNRLLREYLPKGSDLSVHSQAELNKIARELNTRPRKTLGYITPAAKFNECVASTD